MNHLRELEEEAIELIRLVCSVNEVEKICCFYSIGKDSSVLLHLFKKAFYPFPIPISFLHIDTGYKFKEMYEFRDKVVASEAINLLTYKHPACLNPFLDGSRYTDVMKTEALKEALKKYGFKIAFGGARREEEKSRAKERMISVRNAYCKWEPRDQNPEISPFYNAFCTENNSLRVFPLSNWTELDIWEYIKLENIDVVPIYFSHERNVISKGGLLLATEDASGELKRVRFRTLGCYPLTGAVESMASNVDEIISELKSAEYTERITRAIDYDVEGSMEIKKKDGYF